MAFRISTITANGNVGLENVNINLDVFFEHIRIIQKTPGLEGFLYSKYRDMVKGIHPKDRKGREKKSFDNQVTTVFYIREDYAPNIKLFRNGNVQMTGVKDIDDGNRIVEAVANEIHRISREHPDAQVANDMSKIVPHNFVIRMINSDFVVPFKLRRKELYNILISEHENTSSYMPESYPGVKLHYYSNTTNTLKDGVCRCTGACFGKGDGNGHTQCKKVTISIFQSGSILITGATSYAQVLDGYRYINNIIKKNETKIMWSVPNAPLPALQLLGAGSSNSII